MNSQIRRGDIYYADLSPVVGSEQGGLIPCYRQSETFSKETVHRFAGGNGGDYQCGDIRKWENP